MKSAQVSYCQRDNFLARGTDFEFSMYYDVKMKSPECESWMFRRKLRVFSLIIHNFLNSSNKKIQSNRVRSDMNQRMVNQIFSGPERKRIIFNITPIT